jgi:hypothetical protein
VREADDGAALPWLTPNHVGAAVRAHQADFGACQALANSDAERREGAVTVGWLVESSGSVSNVTMAASTFVEALVNDCVLSVARRVTFPRSAAQTEVSWTVRLRGEASRALAETAHLDAHR